MIRARRTTGKQELGITLIELMVAVAIAAILAVSMLPSFGVWTANAQIRSVAEALQNDLRFAQNAALLQNRTISFLLIEAEPVVANVAATAVPDARRWLLRRSASIPAADDFLRGFSVAGSASHVRVIAFPGPGSEVRFDALGRLAAAAEVGFDISSTANADPNLKPLRVLVSPGGRVRMCDPDPATRLSPNDSRKC